MKKILLVVALLGSLVYGEDTNTTFAPSVKGFYFGAGLGLSTQNLGSSNGTYLVNENNASSKISIDTLDSLDSKDLGYLFYGGYQFNKIVAIEVAYTDYGSFSGNYQGQAYTKDPYSLSLSANLGYSFFEGELRPFGLVGLSYLNSNQSKSYNDLGFKDEVLAFHFGFGIDYYPAELNGFGIRASYATDSYVDIDSKVYEGENSTAITSKTVWQTYGLLYLGLAYKF